MYIPVISQTVHTPLTSTQVKKQTITSTTEAPSCPLLVITYSPSRIVTTLTCKAYIRFACFYSFYISEIETGRQQDITAAQLE